MSSYLDRLKEKGLSPQEEAVFRKALYEEYDAALVPADENEERKVLYFAQLKAGSRCPQDVTGICSDQVERASVVVDIIGNERVPYHKRVTVQWYGQTQDANLEPLQFRFELMAKADDIRWMAGPDKFQVAFIGQIKDWPNPEAEPFVIASFKDATADSYVAWVWTDRYTISSIHGEMPGSFACRVLGLGNPSIGAIFPKTYVNTADLDQAVALLLEKERRRIEREDRGMSNLEDWTLSDM